MAYDMKDMTGSLWPNDKREKDTHPNSTGKIKIDGKEYYLSGWTKETNGKKWVSLAVKPVDTSKVPTVAELEDDLPF